MRRSKKGFVYVISNEHTKDGIFKIGLTTTTVEKRMKELKSTGVIGDFQKDFSIFTEDCHRLEKLAHLHFDNRRLEGEFFKVPLHEIITYLKQSEFETILRQQDKLNKRMCQINGVNLEEHEEDIEDHLEDIYNENDYTDIIIEHKSGATAKGLYDLEYGEGIITMVSGKCNIIQQQDLLNYSDSSRKLHKSTMSQQWKLIESGYIDICGSILKPIELTVSKSCRVILGTSGGNAWKTWKVKESNEPLENFKK